MSGYFWRIWAVFLVLSILWLGWCIKTSPPAKAQNGVAEVIKAKAFQVVDDDGNLRATLGLDSEGTSHLEFYDAQGGLHAFLILHPSGYVGFGLHDAQGEQRLGFGVNRDGSPQLILYNTRGEPSAVLIAPSDGSAYMALSDAKGEVLFHAP